MEWKREKVFVKILCLKYFGVFFVFSLYFFDEEFYTDVKTLNDQENGGIGVVLGRKVRIFQIKIFNFTKKIK
jgi:hypothetical protein